MTKKDDIVWLAGYLEGEGSFCFFNRSGDNSHLKKFVISVSSTDKDIIERVGKLFNCYVNTGLYHQKMGYKTTYKSGITGKKAIGWMMTLYSLMGERRKLQIKKTILEWRGYDSYKKSLRKVS